MQVDKIEIMNSSAIMQSDRALIDSQIATAKAYPRDLRQCISRSKLVATLNEDIAKSCVYALRKGTKVVSGPSVNLAKIVLQNFGNMRCENKVNQAEATTISATATVFDLEMNLAMRTTVQRSIIGNEGRYNESMIAMTGNAANAIALRNAVFVVIPKEIIDDIYNAVVNHLAGSVTDKESLAKRRTAVIKGIKENYATFKITEAEIVASVGKSSIEHINAVDITTLLGYENAIAAGEMTALEAFRPEAVKKPTNKVDPPDSKKAEAERLLKLIESAKDIPGLEKFKQYCTTPESATAYDNKLKTFKTPA